MYVAPAPAPEQLEADQPAFMKAFDHLPAHPSSELVETHANEEQSCGNKSWSCGVCTYCHEGEEAQFLQCAICGTPRTMPSENAARNSEPASGFNSNQQTGPDTSSNAMSFNPNAGAFKPSWMDSGPAHMDEP